MGVVRVRLNKGMLAAMALLAVGAVLLFLEGHVAVEEGLLQKVGFGIVIVASVLYLGARISMLAGRGRDRG